MFPRTLKPGYTQWISEAFFKDENGEPRIWYHGTDVEPFNIFTRWEEASIGFHFGCEETAADRLRMILEVADKEQGAIIPVICRASRPLRLRDQFMWGQHSVAHALFSVGVLNSQDEIDFIVESGRDSMIFAALEDAGYDAIIYKNECEGPGKNQDSLLVWRAELLKSPDAASFDFDDPRLLPQKPAPKADYRRWEVLSDEIAADAADLYSFRCDPEAWFEEEMGASP